VDEVAAQLSGADQRSYCTVSPVTTEMGDLRQVYVLVLIQPSRLTQPGHPFTAAGKEETARSV